MIKVMKPWMCLIVGMWVLGLFSAPRMAFAVKIGDKAPDFELTATTGKKITLSQFRGKNMVLIEFYVSDFGPT